MNAVIMSGGFGTRLRPLTDDTPKPLLSVCGKHIIDYPVAQLYYYGVRKIIFTLGYLPHQIIEHAIAYKGITTNFSVEDVPLGTLGGVKAISDLLDDVFVVMSGDGINDIDLNAMLNRHLANKSEVTIAIKKVDSPALYGLVEKGEDGMVKRFVEKPHGVTAPSFINCGVYVVNKSALSYVQLSTCDFARDLFPILMDARKLGFYEHSGYWQDVGDFTSFYRANYDMFEFNYFPFLGNFNGKNDYLTFGNSRISQSSHIKGHFNRCIVGQNCYLNGNFKNCVVLDNTVITGDYSDCIICKNATINIEFRSGSDINFTHGLESGKHIR